jgi:hypothetical protein
MLSATPGQRVIVRSIWLTPTFRDLKTSPQLATVIATDGPAAWVRYDDPFNGTGIVRLADLLEATDENVALAHTPA